MSLCARCGMNEPLPTDPDDLCGDCALETEFILAEIEDRRREGARFTGGWIGRDPDHPSQTLAPEKFACVGVCECGGNPSCPRCNP